MSLSLSNFSLSFQFLTILRLPPGFEAVVSEGGDHVLDGVAGCVIRSLIVHLPGVTHKTFLLILEERERESSSTTLLVCGTNEA